MDYNSQVKDLSYPLLIGFESKTAVSARGDFFFIQPWADYKIWICWADKNSVWFAIDNMLCYTGGDIFKGKQSKRKDIRGSRKYTSPTGFAFRFHRHTDDKTYRSQSSVWRVFKRRTV